MSHRSVCLLERGNICPRCYPCPSPMLIQVSIGTEGKVAKDGHEQDWFQKTGWEQFKDWPQHLKDDRPNFIAGNSAHGVVPNDMDPRE